MTVRQSTELTQKGQFMGDYQTVSIRNKSYGPVRIHRGQHSSPRLSWILAVYIVERENS